MSIETYTIKIASLPDEQIEAASPADAAHAAAFLLARREALQKLADDEAVEIKRADGTPWGRNLTIGAFRRKEIDYDAGPEGPVHEPSVAGP